MYEIFIFHVPKSILSTSVLSVYKLHVLSIRLGTRLAGFGIVPAHQVALIPAVGNRNLLRFSGEIGVLHFERLQPISTFTHTHTHTHTIVE